jgi:hypothetical protein
MSTAFRDIRPATMAMSSPSGTTKPGDGPITDFDPSEDAVELVGFGGSLSAETGGIELAICSFVGATSAPATPNAYLYMSRS